MNESQRQAYLSAMGIQPYYPRRPLAAAKPSPRYEFDPDRLSTTGTVVTTPARPIRDSQPEPKPATRTTSAPRAPVVPVSAQPLARKEPTAAVPADTAAAADALRFRLHYYRISESLAVIDEVPHQQARNEAGSSLSLLHGILKALGVECGEVTFEPELFHWPLAEGMAMKNDPAVEARKALQGFITMRQQTDRFKHLIIFAGQVEEVLGSASQPLNRDAMAESGSYYVTITHSLQSMLAYPVLKRDVWAHLQPLRKRLADAAVVRGA
jgi:hypothetical protein